MTNADQTALREALRLYYPFRPCNGGLFSDDWEAEVWDNKDRPFITITTHDGELAMQLRYFLASCLNKAVEDS